MQGSEILRPETRGIQGSNMQNARMDGMGIVVTGANSMETLQQIEVLNGLGRRVVRSGQSVGDVQLRAEASDRAAVPAGDGQLRRPIDGDRPRRRRRPRRERQEVRLSRQRAVRRRRDDSSRAAISDAALASLAADVRPFAHTTIEGFYSYYNVVQRGFPGWFTYGRANNRATFILLPQDAPDPARQGYGQPSAGLDLTSRIGQLRVKHDLNANWRLSVGVLDPAHRSRHQHAGQRAHRQRRQLHRVAGQRLRAAVWCAQQSGAT